MSWPGSDGRSAEYRVVLRAMSERISDADAAIVAGDRSRFAEAMAELQHEMIRMVELHAAITGRPTPWQGENPGTH